jgi:dolichol-phosphate mannosyltransferase
MLSEAGPELTIVVPTLDERDNVGTLIDQLDRLLVGVDWEAVFVDAIRRTAHGRISAGLRIRRSAHPRYPSIRQPRFELRLHRGHPVDSARYIAVIDGDLQHDETLLPRMLDILRPEKTDLVVASRYLASGASDGLSSSGAC